MKIETKTNKTAKSLLQNMGLEIMVQWLRACTADEKNAYSAAIR